MSILEAFRVAWQAMLTHKLRSLLTMLGIIIGVGAVVGMLAIGDGYQLFIEREFNKIGVGVFYVNPQVDSRNTDETLRPQLRADDADAIMRPGAASAVELVALELNRSGTVSAGGERYLFGVKGVTPNFFHIGDTSLGAGRYFSVAEDAANARVAVLGDGVAKTLFGDIYSAVGQRISLNGVQFDVIGVSTTKQSGIAGAVGRFSSPSEQVYVPYRTARDRLFRNDVGSRIDVSSMTVRARSVPEIEEAIRQVTAVLRDEHRLTYQSNDFRVTNPQQASDQLKQITAGFS
ncbi:MAG: ABC transporter permease, partial [Oscillochloris sp.]|nr:ABC transporter permease [Oscillochloris sp.]